MRTQMNIWNIRRAGAASRRGFTLLEIIVVVTIIALLAGIVMPKLLQHIGKSKQSIAKAEVASIAEQLQLYLAEYGMSMPTDDMDLDVLTMGSSPPLDADDLLDPWERLYFLRFPGQTNPSSFDVVSYGADGESGGEGENADIVN
ncbi:MAG: type II secretion system protein GspG [Phycisphaerales bacterium]|nr:type II secretion system protein GspG [Phycisphaerales bacterium]